MPSDLRIRDIFLLTATLLALCGVAIADDPSSAGRLSDAQVTSLVADLSDESWSAREAAEKVLTEADPGVLRQLDQHLAVSRDPEALRRLERIYRHHVPKSAYVGETPVPGFLGIQMDNTTVTADDSPVLSGRECGIVVVEVVAPQDGSEPTAAQKVGLQSGDLIVAIDGQKFVGDVSTAHLAERISRVGAGGTFPLVFYRGDKRHEVQVTLGRRVATAPAGGPAVVPSESDADASKEDPKVVAYRWSKYWEARRRRVASCDGDGPVEPRPALNDRQDSQ